MSSKKNTILLISLILVLALSFLIFFGFGNSKTNIQIVSFIFIIISEIVAYGVTMLITNKKDLNTFVIAGLSSSTFIYFLISFVLNIFSNGLFKHFRPVLITNLCILLVYLLLDTIIFLFKKEVKK